MIRTFIAIPVPDELKQVLQATISKLKVKNSAVKWVRPEGVHLTLKFLGDIEEQLIEPISNKLDEIIRQYPILKLGTSQCGVFPNMRNPRVIWVGLRGDIDILKQMTSSLDRMCSQFGVPPEKRPFNAHITLGRLKYPSVVDLNIDINEIDFSASEVHFYRSELLKTGARYTVLHNSHLGYKGG